MKSKEVIEVLNKGGIGVLATDTIYGLVGQALNKNTVERIYRAKGRAPEKPLIILISGKKDLELFGVVLSPKTEEILGRIWPGPVSVILPIERNDLEYLDRGTMTLAFRLPEKSELLEIIRQTGPLVAPSANPEGLAPAKDIFEAKNYFSNQVDFYLDSGRIEGEASSLIMIKNGEIQVLRGDIKKI